MEAQRLGAIAAFSGLSAVAMGAFAAHGLAKRLSPRLLEVLETAVLYQFVHTLLLLVVVVLMQRAVSRWLQLSAYTLVTGLVLFCGSLYVLALSGAHALGMVTPIGGFAFMLGWLFLALYFIRDVRGEVDGA